MRNYVFKAKTTSQTLCFNRTNRYWLCLSCSVSCGPNFLKCCQVDKLSLVNLWTVRNNEHIMKCTQEKRECDITALGREKRLLFVYSVWLFLNDCQSRVVQSAHIDELIGEWRQQSLFHDTLKENTAVLRGEMWLLSWLIAFLVTSLTIDELTPDW